MAEYKRAVEACPDIATLHNNLGLCHYNFEKGVELGNRAVSLLGPATLEEYQALAYNNLALCLWKSGKKLEAQESMKKALALNPSSPLIQQNIEVLQSGCVVVTAATGSYSHPFVVELTQFRDDMLCKSAGRWLIRVITQSDLASPA